MKYGVIAGNGRFPILVLENARRLGHEVVVIGIKEEAAAEIESLAATCHWISLGQLGKLIDVLHQESVSEVMMAGQVKHAKIFSTIKPDWRLVKLLGSLATKNTDSLIGAVMKALEDEGIQLVDSTRLLKELLADEGVMTRRQPSKDELRDIEYGLGIADAVAGYDVGQSVVISDRACVAVEAMEGTDATLRRAATIVNGSAMRLIKVSRRRRHLLFDVPVAGLETIEVMRETGTTALAVDAGRTLLLDKQQLLEAADRHSITIVGRPPRD